MIEFTPKGLSNPILAQRVASTLRFESWGSHGVNSAACEKMIAEQIGVAPEQVLLTNSCSAALDIAALSVDPKLIGDWNIEVKSDRVVIMPAFTFASTASSFARIGHVPLFVDINLATLTLDPKQVLLAVKDCERDESAAAIVAVHYAGACGEFEMLDEISGDWGIPLIEDAAQAYLSFMTPRFDNRAGTIGQLGCFSFSNTKNISCGEGGALIVNDPALLHAAEIARDKSTNYGQFRRNKLSFYEWSGHGSAYSMNEITATVLRYQLEQAQRITEYRQNLWKRYASNLNSALLASQRVLSHSTICANGHCFWFVLNNKLTRETMLDALKLRGIQAAAHYPPLHLSLGAKRFGAITHGDLPNTMLACNGIVRLPLHHDLDEADIDRVSEAVVELLRE